MKTKTAISFGLVDVNAKPDATFSTTDKQDFVDLAQLKRDELDIRKYATLEKDYFRLDGTFELFPDEPSESDFGLWSASMRRISGRNLLMDSNTIFLSGSDTPANSNRSNGIVEFLSDANSNAYTWIHSKLSSNLDFAGDLGKIFSIGVDIKITGDLKETTKLYFGIDFRNVDNHDKKMIAEIYINPLSIGEWIRFHANALYQGETPAGRSLTYITGYDADGITVEYKNIKLEKGNIATPWTPAPEDLEPLTIEFTEPHSSLGLTFTFCEPTDDYCTEMDIEWYNGTTLLSEKKFYPDSVVYFADNPVENYNKVVISFLETNKPYRYVKLLQIDFGQIKLFSSKDLTSANILEEVDPISSELRINTLDFNLHSKNAEFSILNPEGVFALLQQRQPLKVFEYLDGVKKNMGTYYLDEWENEDEHNISMKGIDLVGVIDGTNFYGGMYNGVAAGTIIMAIMTSANAEYELDSSLEDITLSGYIPICTHREALQQVAFAIGAVVNCSRGHKIRIYPAPSTVVSIIPKNRKFQGHKLRLKPFVTGVEVTAHNYINGEDNPQIFGVYNENLSPSDKVNILTVEDATLVSNSNAQTVAQRVYDYYQQRHQDEGEILLQNEECGQLVEIPSLNNQNIRGIVEKLDIDLTGGFIANATITGGVVQ